RGGIAQGDDGAGVRHVDGAAVRLPAGLARTAADRDQAERHAGIAAAADRLRAHANGAVAGGRDSAGIAHHHGPRLAAHAAVAAHAGDDAGADAARAAAARVGLGVDAEGPVAV